MDCQDAQDRLLQAEDLSPEGLPSGELAAHLADCAACRQLLIDLVHLEEAWRAIPLPAGSERARRRSSSGSPGQWPGSSRAAAAPALAGTDAVSRRNG